MEGTGLQGMDGASLRRSMRVLDFRAMWEDLNDSEGDTWCDTDQIEVSEFFQLLEEGKLDKNTLGQKTGLKDKNGVEIYEGDITRFHTDEPTHWMQEADIASGHVTKEVVWHEGKFHLNKDGDVLNWHATSKPQNLEVIGNIYESPELLESK